MGRGQMLNKISAIGLDARTVTDNNVRDPTATRRRPKSSSSRRTCTRAARGRPSRHLLGNTPTRTPPTKSHPRSRTVPDTAARTDADLKRLLLRDRPRAQSRGRHEEVRFLHRPDRPASVYFVAGGVIFSEHLNNMNELKTIKFISTPHQMSHCEESVNV